jgi:hypothetical protein
MKLPAPSHEASLCYEIDRTKSLRVEEYRGVVGLDDIKALTRAVTSDPGWSPDLNGLMDFSEARLELSADDVMRLALMWRAKEYRSHGWLAFAVPTAAAFGMVRMLGHWARVTERSKIFPNRAEAERWLMEQGLCPPRHALPPVAGR